MAESIKKFIIKDAHGGTKESGSFSVVGEVHVNLVPGYGEPYADSEYVNGILTITIHNIEGNGITEITTDSQEGDEAVNTVTIKTNANPEGVTLEVRNGSRGNGIASISEVLSPEDGGTNTHTITDTDGNEHVIHTVNGHEGKQGHQGDSVLVGEGDLPLAHTTGLSNQKAMSQVGVTDAIQQGMISNGVTTETQNVNYYIQNSSNAWKVDATTGQFTSSGAWRSIQIDLEDDMKSIVLPATSEVRGYAFVTNDGTRISGGDANSGTVTLDADEAMRAGSTKFRCCVNDISASRTSIAITIKRETFSWPQKYTEIGDNEDGWMTQKAVTQALNDINESLDGELDDIKVSNGEETTVVFKPYYSNGSTTGFYVNANTGQFVASASHRSIELDLTKDIKIIKYVAYAYTGSIPGGYAFVKSDGTYVSGVNTRTSGLTTIDAATPISLGASKFRCCINTLSGSSIELTIVKETFSWPQKYTEIGRNENGWMTQEAVTRELIDIKKGSFANVSATAINSIAAGSEWTGVGDTFTAASGTTYKVLNIGYVQKGDIFRITRSAVFSAQHDYYCRLTVCLSDSEPDVGVSFTKLARTSDVVVDMQFEVPADGYLSVAAYVSSGAAPTISKATMWREDIENQIASMGSNTQIKTYHVSEENGDDTNDGLSESTAFATVSKALSVSGSDVSLSLHGNFFTPIIISGKNAVRIRGNDARIIIGDKIDDAVLVSGQTNVYVKEMASFPQEYVSSGVNYGLWLWQEGIEDPSSAVTAYDKHPLQKGRGYRLPYTKIPRVDGSITTASAAIEAIEQSETPVYFYDSSSHNLYFSITSGSDLSENPVWVKKTSYYACDIQCNELLMDKVESYFGVVNLDCISSKLVGCTSLFASHGFRWSNANAVTGSATFVRCEAGGCFYSDGNGDGFGSKVGGSILIDCWAHDCFDDGYSEHGGSESTIIGGLFEHNGKGGVVPSSTRITLYGVMARYNGFRTSTPAGFCFVKQSSPVMGYLLNCTSYGNTNNYLINGMDCVMICEGCHSKDADPSGYGYRNPNGYATVILRNCTHSGTGTAKYNIFRIENDINNIVE